MPSFTPNDDTTNQKQDHNKPSKRDKIKAILISEKPDHGWSSKKKKIVAFFANQKPNDQVIHYQSNQLYHSHSSSTITTINTLDSNDIRNAQQIAHDLRIMGSDIALIIRGKRVIISKASVSALCNDFVSNELANSPRLSAILLDDLANQRKISIHHSETLAGNVLKRKYATELPKAAIAASVIAAVGDFSQFKDIIDTFFKYEYSDTITSHNTYSTHYYANDEYTVTGCFLSRNIHKKHEVRKFGWGSGKFTDIGYETQCYLFTFKVAQAAKFVERYLSG